jgi:hypothetical protein
VQLAYEIDAKQKYLFFHLPEEGLQKTLKRVTSSALKEKGTQHKNNSTRATKVYDYKWSLSLTSGNAN